MATTSYYSESRNARMKAKMEEIIERGRASALNAYNYIQTNVPTDQLVKAKVLNFEPNGNGVYVNIPDKEGTHRQTLHRNAHGQIMERAGLHMDYVRTLEAASDDGKWGPKLLTHSLNEIYKHQGETRYLTRSINNEVRGFLSNKFRRLDSRPILDGLVKASQAIGAIPTSGIVNDTRVALNVILPRVFEIKGAGGYNDYIIWGFSWQNSDYGNGAHNLLEYFMRLICENGATGQETLRQIHLGAALKEDDIWSAKTYKLDTERSASMVRDTVANYLSPSKLEEKVKLLEQVSSETIDVKNRMDWLKKQLGAGKAKEVVDTFNSPDVENLPPGNTSWRLSNAISWIAGKEEDGAKKMELMAVAGDAMYNGVKKAA